VKTWRELWEYSLGCGTIVIWHVAWRCTVVSGWFSTAARAARVSSLSFWEEAISNLIAHIITCTVYCTVRTVLVGPKVPTFCIMMYLRAHMARIHSFKQELAKRKYYACQNSKTVLIFILDCLSLDDLSCCDIRISLRTFSFFPKISHAWCTR
jgi:hypothetical protein